MVVKVYISGISGNKEVKKRQQRVLMILDSKTIKYDVIDITEPGRESDKDFMQNNAKSNGGTVSDPNPRSPLPPQVFNDEEYCGDYDQFDLANEIDTLEQFLKVEVPPEEPQVEAEKEKVVNGDAEGEEKELKEKSQEKDSADTVKTDEIKEESAAKEKTPSRDVTPANRVSSKETTPVKDTEETATKEDTGKETSPERQKSVEKEETTKEKSPSPAKEKSPTPVKERSPSPVKEKSPSPVKEKSPAKEEIEHSKEATPVEEDEPESKQSKEPTPEKEETINENGTASSREQSVEKGAIESKKDNPSESLIASEQAAAAE